MIRLVLVASGLCIRDSLCTVCRDAQSAVVYGDELVVGNRNGSSTVFRITPNGSNAYPVRTTR